MSMNLMGYLKNVDKLASIRADESLAFSVSLLERMMGSKNESNGIMLHELLRTIGNLSEIPQNRWRLVQNGLIKAISKIVRGKLVKRAHWKPADRKNEFCSLEKALAIKCLYSYVIDSDFSGTVLEDESLLKGTTTEDYFILAHKLMNLTYLCFYCTDKFFNI